ncbi:MAG: hypothetical protein U0324_02475 [Polyangiales bacterium]
MTSTDETTTPEATPEATAAPTAPPATTPDDPETVRALARDTLAACRDNPGDPESLPKLNTVLQLVHDPSLVKEVLAAGDAVIRATTADPAPAPAVHAHMTVLFALLLEYDAARDAVDALFAAWLKHPKSFGPAHATPSDYQRDAFFQRLGDMIGWGTVDVKRDRDALVRFCQWVDTWTPKNKFRARRAIDLVRRNFPAPDVWNVIHFPQGGGAPHHHGPQHGAPHGDDRGNREGPRGNRDHRGQRGGKGPKGGNTPKPEAAKAAAPGAPSAPEAPAAPEAPTPDASPAEG